MAKQVKKEVGKSAPEDKVNPPIPVPVPKEEKKEEIVIDTKITGPVEVKPKSKGRWFRGKWRKDL